MPSLTLTVLCFLLRAHSVALLCVQGAGEPDDIGVLDCLLEQYNVLERPKNLTVVDISLRTDSSTTPDETSLDYRFTVTLEHRYVDERLHFQPSNSTDPTRESLTITLRNASVVFKRAASLAQYDSTGLDET